MPISITATRCVLAQAQQRQRQADVVVEVALGREHARRTPQCARRIAASISFTVVLPLLPVTRDERQREARAPVRGELPERRAADRRTAIERAASTRRSTRLVGDQRRRRALRAAPRATKSWPSKRSPFERDEQVARARCARLSVVTRVKRTFGRRAARPPTARAAVAVSIMRALHAASAAPRYLRRRENGVRSPAISW